MNSARYSFVIPVFNEEAALAELFRRLAALMDGLDGPAEAIFVDDGSSDRSYALMIEQGNRDSRFRAVRLSRNFGHQVAITAGLDYAGGDAAIVMDADLQDPPEAVLEMIERWRQGYEVVYAARAERVGESAFKRASATIFYRFLTRIAKVDAPLDVGDFRLVDRKALDAFRAMRESARYVRGMFSWVGFRQTGVAYRRQERFAGESKYSFRKMLRFALDAVVSFSTFPLRLVLNVGFLIAGISFLAGIAAVIAKLLNAFVVPGWTSLLIGVTFLGGVQLIVLGVLGEYLSRIYDEVKNRPLYLVDDLHGFPSPDASLKRRPGSESTAVRRRDEGTQRR